MNLDRITAVAILLLIPMMSSAQKTLTASGSYTFYGTTDITLDQAKSIALERAKTQIIADNFGTVVGVSNTTMVSNTPESSSVSFLSLGESEVKGEWIETTKDPQYEISFEKGMMVVTVKVTGKIRELTASKIQFDSKVLCNGTEDRYETDRFRTGDNLYVSFATPVDGYVAIYLYDQSGICRLLPLKYDKEGSVKVESGKRVVFFGRRDRVYDVQENRYVDKTVSEYVMTCGGTQEINRIYVVYSPNRFARPLDNISEAQDMPASLSFESFQKWLAKSRRQDVDMAVKVTDIQIKNR